MARTKRDENQRDSEQLSPFGEMVEEALRNFRDPLLLGQKSPLASPYLLRSVTGPMNLDDYARGEALCDQLRKAANQIDDPTYGERYRRIILEYYCGEQDFSVDQMKAALILSKVAFHENRRRAIGALERVLLEQLKPALHLERPLRVERTLHGRAELLPPCRAVLQKSGAVIIEGHGGTGKSLFASVLANEWRKSEIFWFTVRPGFNDHLSSLLFALGYFLYRCKESLLWRDMLARTAPAEPEMALDVLRYALNTLKRDGKPPLLCFDDLGLLQADEHGEHAQLLQLLRGLRGLAPTLLIGHQPALEGDHVCMLDDLNLPDTARMLQEAKISDLDIQDIGRIQQYTRGNPQLLDLLTILLREGKAVDEVLQQLPEFASVEQLLLQAYQSLDEPQRSVCQTLSVYRSVAPGDIWSGEPKMRTALAALTQRGLVQQDENGGVFLLGAYRGALYRTLPPAQQRELHMNAAKVRAARAAYAAAAYHLACAEQPAEALTLWRKYHDAEISQGQAGTAVEIFRRIVASEHAIPAMKQEASLRLAELQRLLGEPDKALGSLKSIVWNTPIFKVEAHTLEGMAASDLSEFDKAEAAYAQALAAAEAMVGAQLAVVHKGLGWMRMRNNELDAALAEGLIAKYEVENFLGYVFELRCEYVRSEQHYLAALKLAREQQHKDGVAKTCLNLAGLYGRQGKFVQAKRYLLETDGCLREMGLAADVYAAKITRAFTLNLAEEYTEALEVLQETIDYFRPPERRRRAGRPQLTPWQDALLQQNLAEAHLGLGQLDAAEQCVSRIILVLKERDVAADSYRTWGEIELERGNLAAAEAHLRNALALVIDKDVYLEAYARRALACVLYKTGRDTEGLEESKAAIRLFQALKLPFEVERTRRRLGKYSVAEGAKTSVVQTS